MDPVPDPLLLRKSGSAGNPTRDLWVCSQELRPLDHGGDLSTMSLGANPLCNVDLEDLKETTVSIKITKIPAEIRTAHRPIACHKDSNVF
jgi:hypothetical protein